MNGHTCHDEQNARAFGGFRVGITLAVVGAVVGEFIAAKRGLGYMLLVANQSFDAPLRFGTVVLLSLQSIALFHLVEVVKALVAVKCGVFERAIWNPAIWDPGHRARRR